MNKLLKLEYRYTSSLQLKIDEMQTDYLTQTLIFLAEVEFKKNKLLHEKIELTHLF